MGPSVVGRDKGCLLVALGVGDLTVDLVGQVPKQAHTVFHQLGREPECLTQDRVSEYSKSVSEDLAQPSA